MPLLHVSALRFMVSGSREQGENQGVCVLLLLHGALTRKHHPNPWCSPPTGGLTVPVCTISKISDTTVALPWWVLGPGTRTTHLPLLLPLRRSSRSSQRTSRVLRHPGPSLWGYGKNRRLPIPLPLLLPLRRSSRSSQRTSRVLRHPGPSLWGYGKNRRLAMLHTVFVTPN